MHCFATRLFFRVMAGILIFLASGCGRPAETYYSLRGEVLGDLAAALQDGDSDRTIKSLDRLAKLTRQTDFIEMLRGRESCRHLIAELDAALSAGDLSRAERAVAGWQSPLATRAELQDIPRKLEALQQIDGYLAGRPYGSAGDMSRALQDVQSSARLLADSPTFLSWLQNELDTLASRRSQESRARIGELLGECDQAAIEKPMELEIAFARLRDFSPTSPVSRLYTSLRDGKTDDLDGLLSDSAATSDPLLRKGIEISVWAWRKKLPPAKISAAAQALGSHPAESRAGRLLRLTAAIDAGHSSRALGLVRGYIDDGSILPPDLLGKTVRAVLMPPSQFNARVWRVPFPSVDDVLGRILQWQNSQAGESGGR